jgi:phosphoribosylpyrophosphate synthetase
MIIDRLAHAGADEMIVATPHSEQMAENCDQYGIKFHHVDPSGFFAETIKTYLPTKTDGLTHVYAPDLGSVPRAVTLAKLLNGSVLYSVKKRDLNDETDIISLTTEKTKEISDKLQTNYNFPQINYAHPESIKGKIIIMVEDEVSTGDTANRTGRHLKKCGAASIFFLATHAVLTPGWRNKLFHENPFEKIIMTNSITRDYEKRTGGFIHDISLSLPLATTIYQAVKNRLQQGTP